MFQHLPTIWDYFWVVGVLFLGLLVLWIVFVIVRKVKMKKSGGYLSGFAAWAPRLFMILSLVTFVSLIVLVGYKPPTLSYRVFQETPDGHGFVDLKAESPSIFLFDDGTISELQGAQPIGDFPRFEFLNNTPETLYIYEVFYFCDAYDFNNECSSSPDELKAEVPPFSYVGICCKPRSWASREEGPPSTVRLELGVENSIYWLTWGPEPGVN